MYELPDVDEPTQDQTGAFGYQPVGDLNVLFMPDGQVGVWDDGGRRYFELGRQGARLLAAQLLDACDRVGQEARDDG